MISQIKNGFQMAVRAALFDIASLVIYILHCVCFTVACFRAKWWVDSACKCTVSLMCQDKTVVFDHNM